jgi:outer membrane protein OmpA-like peptidoglycan-associated protein
MQLQDNPELASRAPLAIKDAQAAVTAAEQRQPDKVLATHLVFMADRKILTAEALAQGQLAVDQRKSLTEQREAMRLQARTQEADKANQRAEAAEVDADAQKRAADAARTETAVALSQADAAKRDALELQNQVDAMQAKVTDRGLVVTLGDVLFASGTAALNSAGDSHLGKLAVFLSKYPDRTVQIEGHTDSIGSDEYNQGLSQRRADAVKSYLVAQSIAATRLTAFGKGENSPVGDNSSATGRQQNRRVEVIIENNLVSSR